MFKKTILTLATLGCFSTTFGQIQSDVLYLLDGQKEVSVKEVGLNSIKYTYPNEETIYTISRHQVIKIVFSSGREEEFKSPIKNIHGLDDYQKVFVTYNPEDIAGLSPTGELFSKASGVTTLSSINEVKNRALDKLKAEAAMTGANVVFIGDIFQRGNQFGGQNQAGTSTLTTFNGVGYSTKKLNYDTVKELLNSRLFHHYQTHKLNRNAWSPERTISTKYGEDRKPIMISITELLEKDGEIYVKTKELPAKSKELKLIHADEEVLILMERNEKITTNYYLISEKSRYFKNLASRIIL